MTVKELLEQLQKAITDDPEVEDYDVVYQDSHYDYNFVFYSDVSSERKRLFSLH